MLMMEPYYRTYPLIGGAHGKGHITAEFDITA